MGELHRLLWREDEFQPGLPTPAAARDKYARWLRSTLEGHNAQVLPFPQVDHEEVARRIQDRRPPSGKGDRGYRDILIWESAVELCSDSDQDIAFVSADARNFAEGPHATLALSLQSELTDRGIGSNRIHYFPSIKTFVDHFLVQNQRLLRQMNDLLSADASVGEALSEGLLEHVSEFEPGGDVHLGFQDAPDVDGYQSMRVLDVARVAIVSARPVIGGQILVEIKLLARAIITLDLRSLRYKLDPHIYGIEVQADGSWVRAGFASAQALQSPEREMSSEAGPSLAAVDFRAQVAFRFGALVDDQLRLGAYEFLWVEAMDLHHPRLLFQDTSLF